MQFRNTESRFGSTTKVLHWVITIGVIVQFYLAYWTIWVLPKNSPTGNFYINGLHKPIGVLILGLAILAVLWKLYNPHPAYPFNMPSWEKISARLVQTILYLTLFIMPISGTIMSVAAGQPPNFFGLYQFPMFIQENKAIAQFAFDIHAITSFVIIGLVAIHILAAIKHHFIDKDNVLKRMLPLGG